MNEFTYEEFAPHLNTTFAVGAEGVELKLVEATKIDRPGEEGGRTPFSLTFVGPLEPELGQGVYTLGHPMMGEFDLFLVPIMSPSDSEKRYEGLFG